LDVTQNKQGSPVATDIANAIRARIKEVTGLNSSAGVSYNKFLAKMASGYRKPNNYFVIPPGRGEGFVAALPIEKFHGVGPATAGKMHGLGIQTGADLARLSMEEMIVRFGNSADYWFKLARGIDDRQVNPDRERKSIGAEDTFADDISTIDEARKMVMPLIDKVWNACEKRDLAGRTATLKVKFANFEQITRSKSQTGPFRTHTGLDQLVDALLLQEFPPRAPVRLLGVTISNFVSNDERVEDQIEMAL
jgi:DNA polymerase-4